MGLTGIITEASFRLIPIETAAIMAEHNPASDLEVTFKWLEDTDYDDQYTVAWIDCASARRHFGRSIVMKGHHARRDELPDDWKDPFFVPPLCSKSIPFNFPSFVLNRFTMAVFNERYYRHQGRKKDLLLLIMLPFLSFGCVSSLESLIWQTRIPSVSSSNP